MTTVISPGIDLFRELPATHDLVHDIRPMLSPRFTHPDAMVTTEGGLDADSIATLSLCRGLDAKLLDTNGNAVHSPAIFAAGLRVHEAWDIAAQNILQAAYTPKGYHFRTKEDDIGWCIKVRGGLATSWMAHPDTFNIMHAHLMEITGIENLAYLAPAPELLYVCPAIEDKAHVAFQQARRLARAEVPRAALEPLVWAHGFPLPL